MIRRVSTKSAPPSQQWRSREEIWKAHLESISPDKLRRLRPDYYWLRFGQKAWISGHVRKANFNPNQPRVSAGNPDGGQWTDANGSSGAVFVEVLGDGSDGSDAFQLASSAVSIDYSEALTGISTIDDTTKALSGTLAQTMQTMDFIPDQTPQAYGTAVHVAFGTLVRFQGLAGIGPTDVEHSFGGYYGESGSIRTDVVLRNDAGDVIAIYDVKTGGATLAAARVRELRDRTGVGPDVPIIEMHVLRGARLKGQVSRQRPIGAIIARLWDAAHHRDSARARLS